MYKIIIKNGTIIDGTGQAMFRGDVGIKDGRIAEIGNLQNETAEKLIDAQGKFVAPGFIDVSNRSDIFWQIFRGPEMESLIYQGVTTILGGNCGLSLAPLAGKETIEFIRKWNGAERTNLDWMEMKDFLGAVEKTKLAVNFGTLVGHNIIRFDILGGSKKRLDSDEMEVAQKMIAKSFEDGALGISFMFDHPYSSKDLLREVFSLAKMSDKKKTICSFELRGEGENIILALGEAMEVAIASGAKVHLAHFQVPGEKNWEKQDEALALLEQAEENGISVSFDLFPYVFSSIGLESLLPSWALEGGKKIMLARIKDKEEREKIAQEMKEKITDYSKVIVNVPSVEKRTNRKTVSGLALAQKKSPEDLILDLLISGKGRVSAISEVLGEENMEKAIVHPLSIISSNDSGYDVDYQKTGDLVHPRSFGTFPRVLGRYVREKKILTWEEAIRKMTGMPAERFGIDGRGMIKKGNMADIVVFDPETITDKATVDDPFQYSRGVESVIINGEIVLQGGEFNGKRMGRIIGRKGSF